MRRLTAAVLAALMLMGCCACGGGDTSSDAEPTGTTGASGSTSSSAAGATTGTTEGGAPGTTENNGQPDATSTTSQHTVPTVSVTPPAKERVFKVEDYGAKGDGVTDDGPAIAEAVKAACNDNSVSKIVQFKANATYRVLSVPKANQIYMSVIQIIYGENITIQGSNTKLLMKAPCRVAHFEESTNVKMQGFVIDYSPKPFVAATVTKVDAGQSYIEFYCKEDLGFTGSLDAPSTYFAFRNRKDERLHYNIRSMEKLSADTYRFHMKDASRVRMASVGESFILPVYGSSHNVGGLFGISKVQDFAMKDVTIYAMPDFGFDVRSNLGSTTFTNVRIEPAPGSDVYLASWRDGFHVKDNFSKLVWDNCYIGPLGDDAFNLSAVICTVDSINKNTRTVSMIPFEGGSTREGLAVGDELVAYNLQSGEAIGEAKVAALVSGGANITVRLDRDLPGLDRGSTIAFYRFNKDYVVKNSYIEGTVRVRSSGTFENCRFNVFWVRVENEYWAEGPVPKNVTFRKCTFTTPYAANAQIFHVGTNTKDQGMAAYKCKNILLDGCTFQKGTYFAQEGNELIVK